MAVHYLGLADSALHAPAAAFGEVELYPDFVTKAAVLTSRLARNHPPPDGNKRVAFECLRTFLDLNSRRWVPPPGDPEETVTTMCALAAGELDEAAFAEWLAGRIEPGDA